MAYHVKYNKDSKNIVAGTMNKNCTKFINCSDVTEEAIEAVRDHFIALSIERNEDMAFAWQYNNGKTLVMKFEMIDTDSIKNKEDK